MKALRYPAMVACACAVSMYLFPFSLRALPQTNTKQMLAVVALCVLLYGMARGRTPMVSRHFLRVSVAAGLVSFCGIVSVTYNNTDDYTYASYILSAWVWLAGAYAVCQFIRLVHGRCSWELLAGYLAAVCVAQCSLALLMDGNPAVKQAVNAVVLQEDLVFQGGVRRLYGIGAALDVAGSRFSAVLIMMIYMLCRGGDVAKRWYHYLACSAAFVYIGIAGNMIARTTTVGIVIGLAYLLYLTLRQARRLESRYFTMWRWLGGVILVGAVAASLLYGTDAKQRKNLRFGFEGFFALAEKGSWSVSSNEKLRSMYVFPDNLKTWLVGDGYFNNPVDVDRHYTGERTVGYYMNTDVGYLRFVFYFGMAGLLAFCWFFILVGRVCIALNPDRKTLFLMLLALHFAIWLKVSTDLFLVFALFLFEERGVGSEDSFSMYLEKTHLVPRNKKLKN